MEFEAFPKIPRLKRDVIITEKIDGTNAQVVIERVPHWDPARVTRTLNDPNVIATMQSGDEHMEAMRVGSRTRWITPGKTTDNYGFAGWVQENADELFKLGEGQHFGEWYGQGIQRNYGLTERRFALFNTSRWGAHNPNTPACCEVVPVLHTGSMQDVNRVLFELSVDGSRAVPGWTTPEGIVVYHTASKQNFKVLLENDHLPKGLAA